ncbi:fumarylacetoacetate hydrolase family protein [Schinkia azotoformans]|uniref:fumarylacetoacetate hydrolase family protein n=1 Tax=Schinkia azotoformans TaxID=1454 RepID=UPI002DB95B2A|nr:fumarylacetoacetate hydrolase family protein [Schinkia azotoformans]MEC1716806.1 fumarylacetoacetate hydrolase family protein [Schinkia azotoformans]MEC1743088.1 fumarylacetoacetate hydrolase family protein [Schinkia azotoformans]MEC1744673.1 fumarylacetoacetate hydrolase family protein [Schinkia azotoformans]MEC1767200.1 fumarylacetoacetate hydrolase family protein [Schinkia azotoformans]MEC1780307.1 fumarylacetoacetate hydrolase family protein [Schinkia azotoformans]
MKLITFTIAGSTRIGAVTNENVVDLNAAYEALQDSQGKIRAKQIAEAYVPNDMTGFLQGGKESMQYANEAIHFALESKEYKGRTLVFAKKDVKVGAPVPEPGKMICVGHNYREHILEMGRQIPEFPVVFAKFSNTVIGPEDDIPFFPISEQLDYEAEFAFVIGKRARNVSQEEALDYVAGYTIVNDVTYRDIQRRTIQWLQGKSVDGTAPMGPWLVTTDELTNPSGLEVVLTVNGEERQHTNTANLVFSVQYLVEFLSNLMTLEPGDVILTGTPGGVGVAMDPPSFLKDGDVVSISIDGVGVLENKVQKAAVEVKN